MSEREIAIKIEEMSKDMAKVIHDGKSIEIYKVNNNTVKFYEVKKKTM